MAHDPTKEPAAATRLRRGDRYEVYIDVRHHLKHNDEAEQHESTAFRFLAHDGTLPMKLVAAGLRSFANELDPPEVVS